MNQIKRYLKYFDREKLKLVKSETFFDDEQGTFEDITDFLGINKEEIKDKSPKLRGNYNYEVNEKVRGLFEDYFREYNRELNSEFGISFE